MSVLEEILEKKKDPKFQSSGSQSTVFDPVRPADRGEEEKSSFYLPTRQEERHYI